MPLPPKRPATRPPAKPGQDSKVLKALATRRPAPPPKPVVGRSPAPAKAAPAPKRATTPPERARPSKIHRTPSGATLRPGGTRPIRAMRPAAPAGSAWRGLSLQWKIVAAVALLIIIAGVATFFVTFTTATAQLDLEIDQRGVAVVGTLATLDEELWIAALHFPPASRRAEQLRGYAYNAISAGMGTSQADWEDLLRTGEYEDARRRREELQTWINNDIQAYEHLTPAISARVIDGVREIVGRLNHVEGEHLDEWLPQGEALVRMNSWLRLLQHPFAVLEMLRSFQAQGDIATVSVTYQPGPNSSYPNPLGMTPAADPGMIELLGHQRQIGNIVVQDARVGERATRSFQLSVPEVYGTFLFIAHVGVDQIKAGQKRLMLKVFLAILVSIGIGVGAAFFISNRITRPLRQLIRDVEEVKAGDLEHETLAMTGDEIGELATTFNQMTIQMKAAREQEIEAQARGHEMEIANQIQRKLLPASIPKFEPYEMRPFYKSAKEVGGDYYDLIEIDPDHLGVVVADVSGKGVPGSMVMSITRTLLRMETDRQKNLSPADTLRHVNRLLAQDIRKGMFVTALYGVLDRKTHVLRVCSAGHNPLVVWKAATKEIKLVNPNGIALGFDKGMLFDRNIKEEEVPLEPGDLLVAYTDGVVESMNASREEYGDERFHALVKEHATQSMGELVGAVTQDLEAHQGEAEQHDDITIVAIRRRA